MNELRPLDQLRSIKAKLSVVIVASVGVTAFMSQLGLTLGWPVWVRPVAAGALALLMAMFLGRGMTRPLRKMAQVTAQMAKGDHSVRLDISRRDEVGQLATAFDAMADELAETDRLREEFVANASHELRTPVAAIRSVLENLVDGVEEPDRATLQQLLGQTERLSTLVGQLLDLSRLDAGVGHGEQTQQMSSVDLSSLLGQISEEVSLANPDVQVVVESPTELFVEGHPHRLGQVFRNIIGNASRFSPPHDEVQVVATQSDGEVQVAVVDNGPGIAAADRERVFERFWQADGVSRLSGGGSGLGLAISKQIVDNHDGAIKVANNPVRGARVVVSLPRRQDDGKPSS